MEATAQYALAYSLTTTAGVRALLALAAVAVAAHFHVLTPPPGFAWLASPVAMWIVIGVAAVEFVSDKIPMLDHAMHALAVIVKPAAGVVLVGGTVHPQSHQVLIGLMALGALNAFGVHAAVATLRAASTVTTGGVGNPFVSLVEDVGAVGSIVLSFFLPMVAAALALIFTLLIWVLARSAYRTVAKARSRA